MIRHRHHIVPKHAGGTDDKENIVSLTVPEHAEAHRILYEKHGSRYDLIAYLCLSGQITGAEAAHAANIAFHRAKRLSEETRRKLSERRMGVSLTAETRERMSRTHRGMKHPQEIKDKIGAAHRGRKIPEERVWRAARSRQALDGTSFTHEGVTYGSYSEAARHLMSGWGVSKEAARARVRTIAGYVRPCVRGRAG